jgi:hypothetical protein
MCSSPKPLLPISEEIAPFKMPRVIQWESLIDINTFNSPGKDIQ